MKLLTTAALEVYDIDGETLFKMKLGDDTVLSTNSGEAAEAFEDFLAELKPAPKEPEGIYLGEPMSDDEIAEAIVNLMFADDDTDEEEEALHRSVAGILQMVERATIRPAQ